MLQLNCEKEKMCSTSILMHSFKTYLLFLLLACGTAAAVAQSPAIRIDKVSIEGNQKNRSDFLLRFIALAPGSLFSDSIVQKDIQQLKNSPAIGHADYRIDSSGASVELIYQVTEVKTLLPIINFGGIEGNFWWKAGFTDINFLGKGQTLSAHYQNNDRRHSGQLYYRQPYIKSSPWGYSISLRKWASREPLYFPEGIVQYNYDNNSIGITGIRRFGFKRMIEFGGTYFIENYAKSQEQFSDITPGPESLRIPKILTKLDYSENFLNYHVFYLDGLAWRLTLQNVFNLSDPAPFNSLQFEGKYFRRFKEKGNLAFRLKLGISTNNDSPFAPFVADSHVNLRGVGNRIDRGTAQAVLNLEYRQTILESSTWGAQCLLFSDLGTWRNPGGKIEDLWNPEQFRHFIGGGFRVIHNKFYGAVLRIDYGIDIYNKEQKGLVIGLGQYF